MFCLVFRVAILQVIIREHKENRIIIPVKHDFFQLLALPGTYQKKTPANCRRPYKQYKTKLIYRRKFLLFRLLRYQGEVPDREGTGIHLQRGDRLGLVSGGAHLHGV
jgi:hypothetical protein